MKIFLLLFFGLIISNVFSQNIDYTNVRPGENVEYCTSHKKMQELLNDPGFKEQFELEQKQFKQEERQYKSISRKRGSIYIIPIVFHILHSGGSENISDNQIFDAVSILNRDYRLQNKDAKNVHPNFINLPTDVEIEFRLATIAPDGSCFNGITRTYTTDTTTNGYKQVGLIKKGNNIFKGEWTGNMYMHVFVCKAIGGSAGYTYRPFGSGNSMTNGIWILHNYVGSIGTSNEIKSRALTHEVGHWLNLMHTWGPNNNPGNKASCDDAAQDEVADTPKTIGVTSCNLDENSCGPRANVENYMDYSYCSKMFTPGQVSRMRTALLSSIGGRNNISSMNNLITVGVTNPSLCKIDFSSDKTVICVGDSVTFIDQSYNNVSGWNWKFENGIPTTSKQKSPKVTFNSPGYHKISLVVSNGKDSISLVKDSFIYVTESPRKITYLESFDYNSIAQNRFWSVVSNQNNQAFQIYKGIGYNDNSCLILRNFVDFGKNTDAIISGTFDLSKVKNSNEITFQFKFAYSKKNSSNVEVLRVYISPDCGHTWDIQQVYTSSFMTNITSASEWFPSSKIDWNTCTITNIPSNFWTKDFRIKIEFQGNDGNNLFIDDINVYPFAPSSEILVGLEQIHSLSSSQLIVSPNPVEDFLTFYIENPTARVSKVSVIDLTGKLVKSENAILLDDFFQGSIQTTDLNSGSYLLKVETNKGTISKHFIVK